MNKQTNQDMENVIKEISRGKSFLISTHVNPEGDAIGSALGMAQGLKELGKDVTVFFEDPVPEMFSFLPSVKDVVHQKNKVKEFDRCIVVDCGDLDRVGKKFNSFKNGKILINIDHHYTNKRFGNINVVDTNACATGEIIYELLNLLHIDITPEIAANIYVAILTDTGSFRYTSSTPRAFDIASEMIKKGVEPYKIAQKVYESNPEKKIRLLGNVLQTLKVSEDGRLASVYVTLSMMQQVSATKDLIDGFVNYPRSIEGIEVAILLREDSSNKVKVSLRSKGIINVAEIAAELGGGGHANAAGCVIEGKLEDIREKVEKTTARRIKWKDL